MDNKYRHNSGTGALHSLRKAIAAGASQVLQHSLRGRSEASNLKAAGGKGGSGHYDGDPLDVTARCIQCQAPLGAVRANQIFCGRNCQNAHFNALTAAARLEGKAGRQCAVCHDTIPVERRADAIYCSNLCRDSAVNPLKRLAMTKVCPHCSIVYRPSRRSQVHCSRDCKNRARREASRAALSKCCDNCHKPYLAWQETSRFCSLKCASISNWAVGSTKTLPWLKEKRRVTARAFDCLFYSAD